MFTKAFLLLFAPISALAATYDVNVGQHGFKFTPDTITAKKGDTINFHIYLGHHGVAEGVYHKPCQPKKDGAWSGFIDTFKLGKPAKDMWTLTVNDTAPTFLYCPTPDLHCQLGMSMVINPSETETLATYQKGAKKTISGMPKNVQGGTVGPNTAPKGSTRHAKLQSRSDE